MNDDPIEQVLDHLADGQRDAALEQLDRLVREEPYNGPLFSLRALIHVDRGQLDQAARDARDAQDIAPEHPFVLYAAAVVAHQQGSMLEAIRLSQRARELAGYYPEATLLEARARAAAGQWPQVARLAEEVTAEDPEHEEAAVLAALARSVERKGELDQDAWQSLAGRFPLSPLARAGSGWTRLTSGEVAGARGEFEQALALDPSLDWAKEGLVLALKAKNPVYALLLRWFLWFGRLPQRTRTFILIGGVVGYNFLRRTAAAQPHLKPVIIPLLVAYLVFLVLSWLADPLLNLLLMAKPEGRRLLKPDDKEGALLVAGCLGLAGAVAGVSALRSFQPGLSAALIVALDSLAVAAAYSRKGARRKTLQLMAAGAFALAIGVVVVQSMSGLFTLLGVLAVVAATWISQFGDDRVSG